MKKKLFIIAVLLFVVLVLTTSCIRQYVCYNGKVESRADKCPKVPSPYIDEKKAREAVESYGAAYARANNNIFTRVNIYSKNTTWYSDVLFTDVKTESVAKVTLEINGNTASITCMTGCDYISNSTVSQ